MIDKFRRTAAREEDGQAIVLVAVLMFALLGFVGLALDFGGAAMAERNDQNAADAIALGAAHYVGAGYSVASQQDQSTLLAKFGLTSSNLTSITFLDSNGNSTTTSSSVVKVTDTVSSTVSTPFIGLLGIHTETVSASASAGVTGIVGCAICILWPSGSSSTAAFQMNGDDKVNVSNGAVIDDDAASCAMKETGNATKGGIYAEETGVVGGTCGSGNFSNFSPAPVTGVQSIPDPFASLQDPLAANPAACGSKLTWSGGTATFTGGGTITGQTINSNATLTLNNGIYCLVNGKLDAHSNSTLVTNNALIYVTCADSSGNAEDCTSPLSNEGQFSVSSTATVTLGAMTSGTYKGMALMYDRNNTDPLSLSGNGSGGITGSIYAKNSTLNMQGTPGGTNDVLVVVAGMTMGGNSTFNDTYDQSAQAQAGVSGLQ